MNKDIKKVHLILMVNTLIIIFNMKKINRRVFLSKIVIVFL